MANVLGSQKRDPVVALERLGWSLRRIQIFFGDARSVDARRLRHRRPGWSPTSRWPRIMG